MASSKPQANLHENTAELIRELHRNKDIIPPFNNELFKECISQINKHYTISFNSLTDIREGRLDSSNAQRVSQVASARGASIQFAHRCCTAYLSERMKRIRHLRWKYGGVLPSSIRSNLHETEVEYFNEYCASLAEYQGGLGENGVNLMTDTKPPQSLFIQVRVLEDYGEFETSDGILVILQKNSIHSLPRNDCEMLIKQGILEIAH